ncbi:hypothetical protein CJF42_15865 [Pseudoalteromonas sp. NBT06-2]|uniref:hypothetical protein n=1 Tax=Pseudoalteromonas sp. NBT06-2 TaxID=2025950 RepID=UPI000BA603DE|nr:hypothetical protein [Pseudoalteromonas sp. NBT06-2]PAJ73458.1 hypothetical protein CJF42_15865 [Pseudoalteromonas sp. NBT06-2]
MQLPQLSSKWQIGLLLSAWLIFATLLIPILQQSLIVHLFIAIPGLMFLGYLMGRTILPEPSTIAKWNQTGIPMLLMASLLFIFWMIPRFLDSSIQQQSFYLLKIFSLTFLCGLPLAWSLKKVSYITLNFFRIEFIATLFRMTWLFMTAKERLCINYLYSEQVLVGKTFLILAILFSLWPAIRVVFGQHKESTQKLKQEYNHAK